MHEIIDVEDILSEPTCVCVYCYRVAGKSLFSRYLRKVLMAQER